MKTIRILFGVAFLISCAVIAGCGDGNQGTFESATGGAAGAAGGGGGGAAPPPDIPSSYEEYSQGTSSVTGGSGAPDYGGGYPGAN